MAEGGLPAVEGYAQGLRVFLVQQALEGGDEAVYRVGIQPLPGGQGADAVIGAVQYTVAVQDHELHGRDLLIRLIRFIIPLFILLYKEQKEAVESELFKF